MISNTFAPARRIRFRARRIFRGWLRSSQTAGIARSGGHRASATPHHRPPPKHRTAGGAKIVFTDEGVRGVYLNELSRKQAH